MDLTLRVFARHSLAEGACLDGQPAVLLEGSWPCSASAGRLRSLDETLDSRHDWIDVEAARCADVAGGVRGAGFAADRAMCGITAPWLDALALRYALLKWVRVVAFFSHVQPLSAGDRLELVGSRDRDEDYADLLVCLCREAGAELRIRWQDSAPQTPYSAPPNRGLRRVAARAADVFQPRLVGDGNRDRVVLCGNPRLLDSVCGELLARRAGVCWLYDRFAFRSWLRWRWAGVGQLVCDSSLGRRNRIANPALPPIVCRRVDLAPLARRWLAGRLAARGTQHTRLIEQIESHFARLRPTAVVVDQDATPMARAAVAIGRRHGATSWVVQHGAPCGRFGYSPLVADGFFAWGRSSARQLVAWGVAPRQILSTGSPWHDHLHRSLAAVRQRTARRERPRNNRGSGPRILLLATVPPRDDRPDPLAQRSNTHTHGEMLRTAFAAVARLPGASLTVRPHPRAPRDPAVQALLARYPMVRGRVVLKGALEEWLAGTDCVLSCMSSAGIDATLAGVPVIQLLPQGSGEVLPHCQWGLAGTARTEAELDRLLAEVLDGQSAGTTQASPDVFGTFERPAAARIADVVLASSRCGPPRPHLSISGRFEDEPAAAEALPAISPQQRG